MHRDIRKLKCRQLQSNKLECIYGKWTEETQDQWLGVNIIFWGIIRIQVSEKVSWELTVSTEASMELEEFKSSWDQTHCLCYFSHASHLKEDLEQIKA